ncbi:hypothetical protein [Paraburkholderia sp. GAS334]|uniref:hypothetical protein n=1 Tax=Paraburkholderia sp. GAS334 TaxID=3035131 RepID=UPI003D1BD500
MNRIETKLLRAAVAVGASLWLARVVFSSKARKEVVAATQAIDEATATSDRPPRRFGGLAGRIRVADAFDAPLYLDDPVTPPKRHYHPRAPGSWLDALKNSRTPPFGFQRGIPLARVSFEARRALYACPSCLWLRSVLRPQENLG